MDLGTQQWGVLALPPVLALLRRCPARAFEAYQSVLPYGMSHDGTVVAVVPVLVIRMLTDGQPALRCGARVLPGSTRTSGARCGARRGAKGSAAHAGRRRAFASCSSATWRARCASISSCTVISNAAAHGGGGEREVPARARRHEYYVLTAPRDLHYGGTATS